MKRVFLRLFALLLCAPLPALAQTTPVTVTAPSGANLNISPKRVTFDRTHRSGSVFIFNQGSAPGSFDISLVDRVMLPDGQIIGLAEALANPDTKIVADRVRSAQAMLQVAPRRVTLAPGQGQTIRLRVVGGGSDPDPGVAELRSHLTIATLPPRDSGTTAEAAAAAVAQRSELSFQINALFGLSIPVIVRPSDVDVRAALENAHLGLAQLGATATAAASKVPVLTVDLVRVGSNSLFGNLEVRLQGQPRSPPLGLARGVGVYAEISRRPLQVLLTRAPAPGEQLEVTFTDDDTSPGKILARTAP